MESIKNRQSNLIWICGLTCNGNTHSFLSTNNELLESFFKNINILFHPSLTDEDFSDIYEKIKNNEIDINFLVVEGSLSLDNDVYFKGFQLNDIINTVIKNVDYIIAIGNCASFGNFPALYSENICGLQYRFDNGEGFLPKSFLSKKGYPVINITGCPSHPDWFIKTVLSLHYGFDIKLDKFNRPKEFFMYLTHDGCIRNEYFEWKVEAEEFGTKEGCLFYHLGCRGPLTHSSCNKILWNELSSKTRAGMPCIGCTEFDFPLRERYFETKTNIGIPEEVPLGVTKRAYIMLSGVAKTFTNQRLNKKLEETD